LGPNGLIEIVKTVKWWKWCKQQTDCGLKGW